MTSRLKEKVALISGASSGIGAAAARVIAEAGARVALADVRDEQGEELTAALKRAAGTNVAMYVHLDATQAEQ
jgi:NAD(P)-dependent dehydrogenase (short-subunit alcohol dehydrogenase family)